MLTTHPHRNGPARVRNRLDAILWHVARYQFRGTSRLAQDAGVAKSAVSRLRRGQGHPDYILLYRVAEAIGRQIGRPLDLREIAVEHGREFPTPFVCSIFGCRCLPSWAYHEDGSLDARYSHLVPGRWTCDDRIEAAGNADR